MEFRFYAADVILRESLNKKYLIIVGENCIWFVLMI
jgi:hypothetical protein